jgi:hypothetical protein
MRAYRIGDSTNENIGSDNCGSIIPIVLDMLAIEGLARLGQIDRARTARPHAGATASAT